MMLTPLNIQVAIIKAFYALAKKSVKYYTGLALGKNNTCLFKEIRLIRAYLEILKNFKIVGSTITCCCSVEGDYTVLLNEDLPITNTPIQFGCDNQGYMVFNGIGYPFTYWYDNSNNKIVIQFVSDAPNPNLISNPDMTINLTGWSVSNFIWNGYGVGSALYNGASADGYLMQDVLEIGKTYNITFDLLTDYDTTPNNTTITVYAGTQSDEVFNDEITNSEVIQLSTTLTCFGNTEFKIVGKSDLNFANLDFFIKNVDVKEVLNTTITITDVAFTDTCNITGNAVSPIEVAEIVVDSESAITVDNAYGVWNGNISILIGSTVVFTSDPIPALIMDDPIAIVEWWATPGNGLSGWVLLYNEGEFVLYSPFNNVDYSQYTAQFNQYEGGSDSFTDFDLSALPPFVNVNTPAYVDILFEQDTFVASQVATTSITLPSGRLPYKAIETPASVNILIPINQFALGQPATMSIPLLELFNSTAQDFYYEGSLMFSHIGSYTDMTTLINSFDLSNGQGFTASDGGFAPIPGEILATTSNASTIFNTAVLGDVYTVKLVNVPLSINTTIGTYTVAAGNTPADVANFIAANIIAQGIFQGTVSVTGTVITLTAPLGTGNSWNYNAGVSTYAFSIEKPGDRAILYYFNGGVGTPTTPVHLLNITAPNIYPQTDYDGDIIEIQYPVEFYEPDGSQFAGAVDDTEGQVTFYDSYSLANIYQTPLNTSFTSVQGMLDDFNSLNTLGAYATIVSNNGTVYTVNIVMPSPPAWGYNGNTLTYTFDPSTGRNYVNVGTYFGGADTTEATYTLVILDGGNNPFRVITDTSNFINLQSIVNNLNSQPTFNSDFIASLSGTNLVITTLDVPLGAAFNNYSFQLFINYTSLQYAANDFTSTIGIMSGGVNLVAPNITLFNDYTSTLIYSLAQNSYDVDGISGFVDYFNNASPFNYSAALNGTQQALPEILSQSLLNMFALSEIPNTVLKAYYQPIGFPPSPPVLIGTFTPTISADYTANGLASGLASAINLNPWTGTASAITSTLKLLSPSGTFGSYNNYLSIITKTIPNVSAIAQVIFTTGAVVSGSIKLIVSLGSVDLGLQNFNIPQTPTQCATAYKTRINNGTGTHGYTAVSQGPTVNIFAPINTGTILNNATISAVTTGGVAIQTVPTPTFKNGTDTTTTIVTSNFQGGGFTTYDVVRFTADPAIYTNVYNGTDFIYNDITNSYTYTGQFFGGSDNTAGQLYLELNKTSLPTSLSVLYQDITNFNYTSFQQWENFINGSSTNLDFSALSAGTDLTINSPEDSFAYFNTDYDLFLSYTYASPQWTSNNYGQLYTITNGVDPVLTPYEGDFTAGVLGDFINSDPCAPTIVTQTCLTNDQVNKIITHINKLTK